MSEKRSSFLQKYKSLQRWQRYLFVAILLFGLYSTTVFFLVPLLIEKILPEKLTEALNRQVTLENISINPYLLTVEVGEFEIRNRQADNIFIGLHSLFLDFQISSLFKLAPVVKTCQVAGLELHGSRINDSIYNFSDLLKAGKGEDKEQVTEEKKPFRFSVNNIEISDSAVYFHDTPYGIRHEIEEIEFSIPFISNLPSHVEIDVEPAFSALINGKFFSSTGQTRPFAGSRNTTFELKLHDVALPYYLAYVPVDLGMEVRQAFLDCRLLLSYSQEAKNYLGLEGEIAIRDIEMELEDGSHLFSLPELAIQISPENLLEGIHRLASVKIDSPSISLYRRRDGILDIPKPAGSKKVAPEEHISKNNVTGQQFDLKIDDIQLLNGTFQLIDQMADTSVTIDQLALAVKNFSLSENAQSHVAVGAMVNSSGLLDVSGEAGINPVKGILDINFTGFEVGSLQGYLISIFTC